MTNYYRYQKLWEKCRYMTPEDLYSVSTRWIEAIIEMNSRAGQFEFVNEQIKMK